MPVTVGAPASLDMTAKAGHITLHSHPAVTGSVFMRGSKSFMGQCADSMIPTSGNRPIVFWDSALDTNLKQQTNCFLGQCFRHKPQATPQLFIWDSVLLIQNLKQQANCFLGQCALDTKPQATD